MKNWETLSKFVLNNAKHFQFAFLRIGMVKGYFIFSKYKSHVKSELEYSSVEIVYFVCSWSYKSSHLGTIWVFRGLSNIKPKVVIVRGKVLAVFERSY